MLKQCSTCWSSHWLGLLLVVVGVYYLARHMEWIVGSFPFWAILAIVIGVTLLLRIQKKK